MPTNIEKNASLHFIQWSSIYIQSTIIYNSIITITVATYIAIIWGLSHPRPTVWLNGRNKLV
jgi:hypothetical protein